MVQATDCIKKRPPNLLLLMFMLSRLLRGCCMEVEGEDVKEAVEEVEGGVCH